MKLSRQTVITAAVAVVIVAVFGVLVARQLASDPDEAKGGERTSIAARADSHRLGAPGDGQVTLVEFMDFECPSCAAAQPFVEQLRETYAGRVEFVVRHFPLDVHRHARDAAHAAEAAAAQGQFEQMHDRLFETQQQWAGADESLAPLFRSYAQELGLDMAAFDAAVASDEVAARVQADMDDGLALGVDRTPTFFLDGEKVEAESTDEFLQEIDDALAG
jgi:protein-disulfide isomerase